MARFTVRLDEELSEWVEEEAERRDRPKAWVLEEAVAAAKGDESVYAESTGAHRVGAKDTGEVRTDEVRTGEHQEQFASQERVDELVERVEALESKVAEGGSEPVEGGGNAATVPSTDTSAAGDTDEAISEVVESWSPGRSSEGRDRRRSALRSALEFLSEEGSATRRDFVDQLYPATALETHSSEDGWWRGMLLKGLKHAAEEGLVEKDGQTWVWLGE